MMPTEQTNNNRKAVLDKLEEYTLKNDFYGKAQFLKQLKFDDPNIQNQMNNQIRALEEYGNITSSVLNEQLTDEDKEKVAFRLHAMSGISNVKDPTSYDIRYKKYITDLGTLNAIPEGANLTPNPDAYKKNTDIKKITYTFEDDNAYDQFTYSIGKNINKGIASKNQLGKNTFTIDKTVFDNPKDAESILRALTTIHPKEDSGFLNSIINKFYTPWKAVSYDKNNKEIVKYNSNYAYGEKRILSLLEDTNSVYKKTLDKNYSKVKESNLVEFPQINDNYARLYDRYNNGLKRTEFEGEKKILDAQTIKDLKANFFSANNSYNEIYMMNMKDNDKAKLSKLSDKDRKTIIKQLHFTLSGPSAEDHVTVNGGVFGGKVGGVITFNQVRTEKGISNETESLEWKIFVPGLFNESLQKYINYNPDLKSVKDIANCQAFNCKFQLDNGAYLSDFNKNGDGGATYHISKLDQQGTYINDENKIKELVKQKNINNINQYRMEDVLGYPKPNAKNYTAEELDKIKKTAIIIARQQYGVPNNYKLDIENNPNDAKLYPFINSYANLLLNYYNIFE